MDSAGFYVTGAGECCYNLFPADGYSQYRSPNVVKVTVFVIILLFVILASYFMAHGIVLVKRWKPVPKRSGVGYRNSQIVNIVTPTNCIVVNPAICASGGTTCTALVNYLTIGSDQKNITESTRPFGKSEAYAKFQVGSVHSCYYDRYEIRRVSYSRYSYAGSKAGTIMIIAALLLYSVGIALSCASLGASVIQVKSDSEFKRNHAERLVDEDEEI